MSRDGEHGLVLIAFVGSVFSPYYALARRRGRADPEQFCALNVALYGKRRKRWAMTERPAKAARRACDAFCIGPSALTWQGDTLTFDVDEITVPWPSRIRGTVRVHPVALTGRGFELDRAGRHRWWPIAPEAAVEVEFSEPGLAWSGRGYLDGNAGDAPLEDGFERWHWSRTGVGDDSVVLYDVTERGGAGEPIAIRISAAGEIEPIQAPPPVALSPTRWRIPRETRADPGGDAVIATTLEDTPFYARSVIRGQLLGRPVTAVHETLSLERFRQPWVQLMLPFRMPRARR